MQTINRYHPRRLVILTLLVLLVLAVIGGPGSFAIAFGSVLVLAGYISQLIFLSSSRTRDTDSSIAISAVRSSSWIILVGLVVIVLVFLYTMGLISRLTR